MTTRQGYSIVFLVLICALTVCSVAAYRSKRSIGRQVAFMCFSLIPPVIGNLMITASQQKILSIAGYYVYFIGMNLMLAALVRYTDRYCQGIGKGTHKPNLIYGALVFDGAQMFLNIWLHHSFDVELIEVEGMPFYSLVPYFGQAIHRAVGFTVMGAVILIFLLASVKTAKVYRERFTVPLITMILVALWQTFYIFSRKPVDRSMIGLALFGILVFLISIYYRPLRLLDRMLSDIASDIPEAMFVFDPTGKCIWANEKGMKLTNVTMKELDIVTERLEELFGRDEHASPEWNDNIVIGSGSEAKYYNLTKRSMSDENRHLAGSFLTVRDDTEEQRRIKRELYDSTHDALTGLYTKHHLFSSIRVNLERFNRTDFLIIFLDVKNFKIVNDVFSSGFGDQALLQVADWIRGHMTDKCVYGRIAGDTFGMLVPADKFDAPRVEEELSGFVVREGSKEHHLLIHLGIYEVAERDTEISVMFDRAHLSLSGINDEYKTHIAYYDEKLRESVLWDQKITAELHEAIEAMQIRPFLQPITDASGKVVGAEALARWVHPVHGMLPPGRFIPVFEKNGMIVEVDRHMWQCACRILSGWKGVHDDVFISVNISPKDFYFFDVVSEIRSLVRKYGIEPAKLRVEITETVMMNEAEDRMKVLSALRKEGFIVEMDDFGSGYSSLNMLKDMPVDVLKIDMKFLSGEDDGGRTQIILRNVLRLSEELDIASLTEGVETERQYRKLAEMGCRMFQGYYFSKPLPEEEFESFAFGRDSQEKT